jgi:hypothetical protein
MGTGDFTKLNIQSGDEGGELDPHGATGAGNPVGGNVTTNIVDGVDEPIAEWMLYIDFNQFCVRACTNANSTCPFFFSFTSPFSLFLIFECQFHRRCRIHVLARTRRDGLRVRYAWNL